MWVGCQCNSIVYFISEICNVPEWDSITGHLATALPTELKEISTNAYRWGWLWTYYMYCTVHITYMYLGRGVYLLGVAYIPSQVFYWQKWLFIFNRTNKSIANMWQDTLLDVLLWLINKQVDHLKMNCVAQTLKQWFMKWTIFNFYDINRKYEFNSYLLK